MTLTRPFTKHLVELLSELEGYDSVVPGVEDEDGEVDEMDELVGAEGDVTLVEGPGEEPLEPRHLPPQGRHRVHADLRVHGQQGSGLFKVSRGFINGFTTFRTGTMKDE